MGLRQRIAAAGSLGVIEELLAEGAAYKWASDRTRGKWQVTAEKRRKSLQKPEKSAKKTESKKEKKASKKTKSNEDN